MKTAIIAAVAIWAATAAAAVMWQTPLNSKRWKGIGPGIGVMLISGNISCRVAVCY